MAAHSAPAARLNLFRSRGSTYTGQAAPPHRNIQHTAAIRAPLRNDIYTSTTTEEQYKENGALGLDWNFAFMVADADGNYGLIEIVSNESYEIVYTPNYGQANFYRNDDSASKEIYPTGGWGKLSFTNGKNYDQENTDRALLDGKNGKPGPSKNRELV